MLLDASACARHGGGEAVKLAPRPHPLVDNFYVAARPAGDLAVLGGAVGTFAVRGRCLELRIGGERRTPVFMGRTGVERGGLVVRGQTIPYGAEVRLASISAPFRLSDVANPACPSEGVFLRSPGD